METHKVTESIEITGNTTYIVRCVMPNKDDVKMIKNKVKKLILNNLNNIDKSDNKSA